MPLTKYPVLILHQDSEEPTLGKELRGVVYRDNIHFGDGTRINIGKVKSIKKVDGKTIVKGVMEYLVV
jgi:hypothetical protein